MIRLTIVSFCVCTDGNLVIFDYLKLFIFCKKIRFQVKFQVPGKLQVVKVLNEYKKKMSKIA